MLFLVMSLLCWSQTDGCSETVVSISGDDQVLSAGDGFNLSCDFTCLSAQHVAQLWWRSPQQERVSLVNITSIFPDVVLVLSISSASKTHTGYYSCKTQPPVTISPDVLIQVEDNLTTSSLTTSSPQRDSTKQHSSLQGQIWYWVLLGKTAVLLFSLVSLCIKYNRG